MRSFLERLRLGFLPYGSPYNYVAPNIGEKPILLKAVFPALIFSVALSYIPALYARFLGRLAWIIEDDITKRLQEEEEGEDSTIDD